MNDKPSSIVSAIRKLESEDSKERLRSREALEGVGKTATWFLIQAVHPGGERTRHEALKALVSQADPAAGDLFIEILDDEDSECRWLAALGLAALGKEGLRRSLEALIEPLNTDRRLRSVHHVLSELETAGFDQVVVPLLRAFQSKVSDLEVPRAAHDALQELRKASHAV